MTKEDLLTVLRYTVLFGLFAILFIPLIIANGYFFPNMFFPYITGKNLTFRFLVELVTIGWVILALYEPIYRPKKTWMLWAVGVFVFIIGLADLLGENPFKSLLSNYERMEGWVTILHLGLYTLVASSVLNTQKIWNTFFSTSIFVSFLVGILSLIQYSSSAAGGSRIDATLGNPAYLAIYMMVHVFLVILFLLRSWGDKKSETPWISTICWYLPILLLQVFTLINTATRGPALGLIGGLIVVALGVAITEKEDKRFKLWAKITLVVVAIVISVFFMIRNSSFVKQNLLLNRLASISLADATTMSRFTIWNMAYQGFKERPILGWGQENFNYIFNKYYDAKLYNQEQWFDRTHNVVLDWLVAGGVLGFVSYISLWVIALYLLWTKTNLSSREKSLFTGLFAAYFFQNLFVFDNITSYILLFTLFAYIASNSSELQKNSNVEFSPQARYVVISIGSILVIFLFYNTVLVPGNGAINMIKALPKELINQPQKKLEAFDRVISANSSGLYEAREQVFTSVSGVMSGQASSTEKEAYLQYARIQGKLQAEHTPNDARHFFLIGKFLYESGQYAEAESYILRAHELSPNKQPITILVGLNYLRLGKIDTALEYFKKAYDTYPANREVAKTYGVIAFYLDKPEITNAILGPGPIMDERFLGLYRDKKEYGLMLEYLKKDVVIKQNSIESRVSLGLGYWIAGKFKDALSTLKAVRVEITNPDQQKQIDDYISKIQKGVVAKF